MRIAIVTTQCPFIVGGAELHADGLVRALQAAGHEAAIITMPFKWYPATTILDHMLAAGSLDISNFNGVPIDLAICLKFPAYLMRHPRKVFWILHQHRQAYDMWDSGLSDLLHDDYGHLLKEAITVADTKELSAAARLFSNSHNVAKRLLHYNGIVAEPLYHPPPLSESLQSGPYGDFYYCPSRLSPSKRQAFVLEALAKTKERVRVIFSGAPDNPTYGEDLHRMAQTLGVADRVEWRGFANTQEVLDLYAQARGIIFPPVDEDLGYVALEAMLASKPLLTLADAGEPAALIHDGVEGFITQPEPAALARAMDRLYETPEAAAIMGAAANARYRELNISWAKVIEKLLGAPVTTKIELRHPAKKESRSTMEMPSSAADLVTPPPAEAPITVPAAPPYFTPAAAAPRLEDIAELYEFGDKLARAEDYFRVHWQRYLSTLDLITQSIIKPRRILEIGTSEPYVFTALLHRLFPEAVFTAISLERTSDTARVKSRVTGGVDLEIALFALNVETTPLPFPGQWFDLVIAMEVLEHLTIDPLFMLDEMARVTRHGGSAVVTTPNLVSIYGLSQAMAGASPYSFGVFVPEQGSYGRHNREYTPLEVARLARAAGFETESLETRDLYPHGSYAPALAAALVTAGDDLMLRGQNIHYVGRKAAGRGPYPADLYPGDPRLLSGIIERFTDSEDPAVLCLRLSNKSPVTWPRSGPDRVRLGVDHVDEHGRRTEDVLRIALPHDVEPGSTAEIKLWIAARAEISLGWFEIGLYFDRLGPFRGAGRCNTISIMAPCLEVQGEAASTSTAQLVLAASS